MWRVVGPDGKVVGPWETLADKAKVLATLLQEKKPDEVFSVYESSWTAIYSVRTIDDILAVMDCNSDRAYVLITRADAEDCHDPEMSMDSQRLLNSEISRFKKFSDLSAAVGKLTEKRPTATVTVLYGDKRQSKPQQAGPMPVGNDLLEEIKSKSILG